MIPSEDGKSGYHLEFVFSDETTADDFCDILANFELIARTTCRKDSYVVYIKSKEQISDFLAYLGAPVASMALMEAKLEKELNNKVNRRCNCDDANTSKVVVAAQEQLAALRILRQRGLFENLPKKLLMAAKAREENPEASLTELAEMMDPPITKPAMNHRLKKLVAMAREASV